MQSIIGKSDFARARPRITAQPEPSIPQDSSTKRTPKVIRIVAVNPVRPLELFSLLEVFHEANRLHEGGQAYDIRLVSSTRDRNLESYTGTSLQADLHYEECFGPADTILISGSEWAPAFSQHDPFLGWLREQSRRSRRTGAVHTGALVLAKAGLLNGRKATTHWEWCDELRNVYPSVSVERNVIYVRHGSFYTSAGATAGIDLALALVEEDLGTALASKIAQMLLVFSRRSGRQPQVSVTLAAQSNEGQPLGELLSWLPDNLQEDLSVAKLARRAAMSPRNFARSFRAQLGTTPAKHIERLRLELAKRHLEATKHGLAGVADACGFANSEMLRRAFLRHCGLTPGQFRASLKSGSPAEITLSGYRPPRQQEELLVAATSPLHAQPLAQSA